jgi:hypothetical protein
VRVLGCQRALTGEAEPVGTVTPKAQRHLFNEFLGQLHHCLQTGQLYNDHRAFATTSRSRLDYKLREMSFPRS